MFPADKFPVMFAFDVIERLLAVTTLPKLALAALIFPVKLPIAELILPALTLPVTLAVPDELRFPAETKPVNVATFPFNVRFTLTVFAVREFARFNVVIVFTTVGSSI